MKTVQLACAVVAIALVAGGAAHADPLSGAYVEADVGAVLNGKLRADGHDVVLGPVALTESLRQGWTAGLLVGRRIATSPVYVEAEGLYLNDAIRSDDINAALGVSAGLRTQTFAGLVNLKLEHPLTANVAGWSLAPYGALGVGYGQNTLSILGADYAGSGLVWQGKAGLALRSKGPVTWDLGYRYVRLPTFDTNKLGLVARMKTDAQAVTVGVRYAF